VANNKNTPEIHITQCRNTATSNLLLQDNPVVNDIKHKLLRLKEALEAW